MFALGDANPIANKIPRETHPANLAYRLVDNRTVITDGSNFLLDVNEFGASR